MHVYRIAFVQTVNEHSDEWPGCRVSLFPFQTPMRSECCPVVFPNVNAPKSLISRTKVILLELSRYDPQRNVGIHIYNAILSLLSFSFSSPQTRLLISNTASKPSLPFWAFCRNRSMLASSIFVLIFCQPPQSAVILAFCSNIVLSWPGDDPELGSCW